jgi:hypothetical protein
MQYLEAIWSFAPNNAMQPTAHSIAFMRKTWPYLSCLRGG